MDLAALGARTGDPAVYLVFIIVAKCHSVAITSLSGHAHVRVRWPEKMRKSLTAILFVFTALHSVQMRSSDENSVRLSVSLSVKRVHCVKTEEISVQIFMLYERSFSLVFWEEEWLVGGWGRHLLPEILGQLALVGAKSPIFNWYSLVASHP